MSVDKVAANHFYKDRGDKTLQNWFLYEYANVLFSKIKESPKLSAYRRRHGDGDITAFCVYFSKRLRRSIARKNENKTPRVEIDGRYVYEFYPENTYAQTQRLLDAAGEAWEEQLMACNACPNPCLTDGFEITGMFDSLEESD